MIPNTNDMIQQSDQVTAQPDDATELIQLQDILLKWKIIERISDLKERLKQFIADKPEVNEIISIIDDITPALRLLQVNDLLRIYDELIEQIKSLK